MTSNRTNYINEEKNLLLKKKSVKVLIPKNLCPNEVYINLEITIFAASKWEIVYVEKNNNRYEKEANRGCLRLQRPSAYGNSFIIK